MAYFWIAVGSALGGVLRHWCSGVAAQLIGATFPWGTLVVNIAGSFAIGFFFTYTGPDGRLLVDSTTRQFVMVGLCGGYTTFSSFSLQTLNLMRDGQVLHAGANILFSVLLCLLAVWLGHMVAAEINQHHSLSHAASEAAMLRWKPPIGMTPRGDRGVPSIDAAGLRHYLGGDGDGVPRNRRRG